jgi:hypothetical protein
MVTIPFGFRVACIDNSQTFELRKVCGRGGESGGGVDGEVEATALAAALAVVVLAAAAAAAAAVAAAAALSATSTAVEATETAYT